MNDFSIAKCATTPTYFNNLLKSRERYSLFQFIKLFSFLVLFFTNSFSLLSQCDNYPNANIVYKVTDSNPTCTIFDNVGSGLIFSNNCDGSGYTPWHAEDDVFLVVYDNSAVMEGTVTKNGVSGQLHISFTGINSNGASNWTNSCYTNNLSNLINYNNFTGGITLSNGSTISIYNSVLNNFNVGNGASNEGTGLGFGGWPDGEIGNCSEMFGNLEPCPTCNQITNSGQIAYTGNVECGAFNPSAISSVSLPSGGTGAIEYLWLSSTTSCPNNLNQAIAGATSATYDPETISETTYYVRCSRRAGCTSWSAGESNCVTIEVESTQAPGTTCNDNNANTINDIIQTDGCTCAGTFDACATNGGDSDNDGMCDDQDCEPNNPNIPALPGTTCDDGNANTVNDMIQPNGCDCAGVIDDCFRLGGDSDNDGVCDSQDCAPNNPNLPAEEGTACNDGNANTSNDVIQEDRCTCAGTPDVETPDCANIGISTSEGTISITGLDGAPITSVQVFTSAWAGVFSCFADCNSPTESIAAPAGDYLVFVKYYNADYSLVCQEEATVTVSGGGGCTDADNDGVCADVDCNDNDASLPAAVGASCNDGNGNTSNDVIQADGCTCEGTPNGGGGTPDCANIGISTSEGTISITGLDGAPITSVQVFTSAWAGVFSCFADCNSPTESIAAPAGDYLVFVKYYNADYSLVCQEEATVTVSGGGGCTDADNDGVCADVDCNDNDASLPAAVGSSCNDGNANTNNDIIQADGCTCAGTPEGGGGTPDCTNIEVSSTNGNLIITGLDGAPITSVQVFTSAWAGVFNCFADCNAPTETIALPAGDYLVFVKYYNADYSQVCQIETTITVGGGGGCTDADNDGVCADVDCNDNDASLPAAVGSSCNDGNANTANDVIQADGCTCAGTPAGGGASIDIALTATGNGNNVGAYQTFSTTFTVTNEGASPSNNVIVNIPQPSGVVFQGSGPFTASTGDYNYYSTFNWTVGTLAPGQSETLTLNYYTIADGPYTVYGQVTNATGTDTDSTPNNGTSPTPNEDDEAVYMTGNGGGGCTDADNDGVCADVDCNDNDASLPAAVGSSCNDGNANTSNDVIQADGCTCAGTPDGGGSTDCADVSISETGGVITLNGLNNAPLTAAWVFDSNWTTLFNCSYGCSETETVSVGEGTYYVIVKKLNLDWSEICIVEETIVVDGGNSTGILTLTGPNNQTITAAPGANSAVVTYPEPVANTTCTAGGLNLVRTQGPASGSAFPVGVTTVTYQATDACGNSETVSFTITVLPTDAVLTLMCPSNITVDAQPDANSAVVTYANATGTTTCGTGGMNITLVGGLASGSAFSVGTTTMTYQATDACGGNTSCTFTVTVNAGLSCNELLSWDLSECYSNSGNNSASIYSEFVPEVTSTVGFSEVWGSTVYREEGTHSCTPGINTDGVGMCIGTRVACDFLDDDVYSTRFRVTLNPSQSGSLSQLRFYEKAPLNYDWIGGASGPNNYPTKYGLRVTKDGQEIFKSTNISTTSNWSLETFDFTNDPDFNITETTTFEFELRGYCRVENGANISVWDLDDISIYGCGVSDFDNNFIEYTQNGENEEMEVEYRDEFIDKVSSEVSFEIYPNPADEQANLKIGGAENTELTIIVTDQFGRKIDYIDLQSFENKNYILNTSNYSSGLYFVQIRNSNGIISTKQLVIMTR